MLAHEVAHVAEPRRARADDRGRRWRRRSSSSRASAAGSRARCSTCSGPVAASFVHLLLSPRREFEADRLAAELCESPHGLADALLRLDQASELVVVRGVARRPSRCTRSTRSPRKGSRSCSSRTRRSASACAGCASSTRTGARSCARPSRILARGLVYPGLPGEQPAWPMMALPSTVGQGAFKQQGEPRCSTRPDTRRPSPGSRERRRPSFSGSSRRERRWPSSSGPIPPWPAQTPVSASAGTSHTIAVLRPRG